MTDDSEAYPVDMIYIPTRGIPMRVQIDVTTIDRMRQLIGGWLEAIGGEEWTCYMDEEGKMKGREVNMLACAVVTVLGWKGIQYGDFICGPVLMCGPTDEEGYDTSVTDRVAKLILEPFETASGE
jgi:hypothetical protein